jgi:hypothetical protein
MAELLVKAVNATHSDPTKDARGCYKRGDVIGVAPDGWSWGTLEKLPPAQGGKFVVVKITDVTRAQVINWVRNNWGFNTDNPAPNLISIARRRLQLAVDLMPNNVRNTLNTTGTFSTTWAAVRQYVTNKLTQATATGATV